MLLWFISVFSISFVLHYFIKFNNNNIDENLKKLKDLNFKHKRDDLNVYDPNNPYWNHNTTLGEYVNAMGGHNGYFIELVFVVV